MSKKAKTIYFVVDPKGKVWNETVATDRHQCQANFVNDWFAALENVEAGSHEAWTIWAMFERANWHIQEIELPEQI